jgi:hypothetical protein
VPLVVPEVNADALAQHQGFIANPNCSTIIALMALGPLHRAAHIRRFVGQLDRVTQSQTVFFCCLVVSIFIINSFVLKLNYFPPHSFSSIKILSSRSMVYANTPIVMCE